MSDPTTRTLLVTSYAKARHVADLHGGLSLNHASAAGWLLEAHGGSAEEALRAADAERLRWDWWGAVVGYLARVVVEEREEKARRSA